MRFLRTLGRRVGLEGVGLHSGVGMRLGIEPITPEMGHGIHIVEMGRGGEDREEGDVSRHRISHTDVCDTRLATRIATPFATLEGEGISVSTIEHLASAVAGLGVDGLVIDLQQEDREADDSQAEFEVPILDGSAAPFVDAFLEAGIVDLPPPSPPHPSFMGPRYGSCRVEDEAGGWLEYVSGKTHRDVCLEEDEVGIRVELDFSSFVPAWSAPFSGWFVVSRSDPRVYVEEIAPAKTFTFASELDALKRHGLAKGGSLDNALVFDQHGHALGTGGGEGIGSDARSALVAHKALDLIGDLSLLPGGFWSLAPGLLSGHKIGHSLNSQLAHRLDGTWPAQ